MAEHTAPIPLSKAGAGDHAQPVPAEHGHQLEVLDNLDTMITALDDTEDTKHAG